ncbi:MAG: hypothetical protein ACE5HO_03565 [bacterium]
MQRRLNRNGLRRSGLFLVLLLFVGCQTEAPPADLRLRWFNLAHLNHLYQEVTMDGAEMAIVHIYSEYPDYGWVDAGDEGIACVDDAARAAVVYLRHFELSADSTSLLRARKLLDFCRHMQAEDGQFYNFIFADHSINRTGRTSHKSFGWWAARAVWALGEGFRVFRNQDAAYAAILEQHIQKTFVHLDTMLVHYHEIAVVEGFDVPHWLLYNSAADATSELVLGLAAYSEASGDARARQFVQKFAEGLMAMQITDDHGFPYYLFLSWKNVWHGWGNSQTQALAIASKVLDNSEIREAAEKEALTFYPYWISNGFPREMIFTRNDSLSVQQVKAYDQIAYAIRPAVVGCLRLYDLTRRPRFAEIAGELAAWFFGGNSARQAMYDPETGRCFDGILSPTEINLNSGAESTIEALYSLLEVEVNPIAWKRLQKFLNSQQIIY